MEIGTRLRSRMPRMTGITRRSSSSCPHKEAVSDIEAGAADSDQADRLCSRTRGFSTNVNDVCACRLHRLIVRTTTAAWKTRKLENSAVRLRTCACFTAAVTVLCRPPSLKLSGVQFRMPITICRKHHQNRRSASQTIQMINHKPTVRWPHSQNVRCSVVGSAHMTRGGPAQQGQTYTVATTRQSSALHLSQTVAAVAAAACATKSQRIRQAPGAATQDQSEQQM